MKKDKFHLLTTAIENEIELLAINYRLLLTSGKTENLDDGYLLGFRAACLKLLGAARSIEERDRLHIPEWGATLADTYLASSLSHWPEFLRYYEEYVASCPVISRSLRPNGRKKTT